MQHMGLIKKTRISGVEYKNTHIQTKMQFHAYHLMKKNVPKLGPKGQNKNVNEFQLVLN
jgi:hypothetical protein